MPTSNIRAQLGLLRSKIMYIWRPLQRRRLQKFYQKLLPKDSLCFDIGAHLGNRIDAFVELGAQVIAVEPQPRCLDYLNRFNDHESVIILPKAVGASPGKATLHISHLTPTVSTLAEKSWRNQLNDKSDMPVHWEETLEVPLITLDQLIEAYGTPDFCKIDVEDYEAEVLKGLSQPIPLLSFEFFTWTPQRTQECLQLLNNLGNYQYNWSVGESMQMQADTWMDAATLTQTISSSKKEFSGDIYAQLVPSIPLKE